MKAFRPRDRHQGAAFKLGHPAKRCKSNDNFQRPTRLESNTSCNVASSSPQSFLPQLADDSDYGDNVDVTDCELVPVYSQPTSMNLVRERPMLTSVQVAQCDAHLGRPYSKKAHRAGLGTGDSQTLLESRALARDIAGVLSRIDANPDRSREHTADHCRISPFPMPFESNSYVWPPVPSVETRQEVDEELAYFSELGFFPCNNDIAAELEIPIVKGARNVEPVSEKPETAKKVNVREVGGTENYDGALMPDKERLQMNINIGPDHIPEERTVHNDGPLTVRQPFPTPMLDRSPIFGASASTLLRTCFRIGEAVSAGAQAARMNQDIIVELYARVTSSYREVPISTCSHARRPQVFTFKDLYHDNPPHLSGASTRWDQCSLWELDSRPFLDAGEGSSSVMCRVVSKLDRTYGSWVCEVLSIWQASWEDVHFMSGIYSRDA